MSKHILITGGAGFIGTNLSRKLLADGYRITVLDNLSPQIHGAYPQLDEPMLRDGRIHFIRADVRHSVVLEEALKSVDAVIHLAAETGTAQSMYQIAHYNEVNTQATAQLLDILANKPHTVKKSFSPPPARSTARAHMIALHMAPYSQVHAVPPN